jgi:hypothetical protein
MNGDAVRAPRNEELVRVFPVRLGDGEHDDARWSVYLIRVHVDPSASSALKVGMVGTGTLRRRLAQHAKRFGVPHVIAVWSLAHAAARLDEEHAWRLVEQYEARLQFAPEFVEPSDRLRRLRPDTLVYSYEWFEDDPRVIEAVERYALKPVTLPHGWMLGDVTRPTERSDETPPTPLSDNDAGDLT